MARALQARVVAMDVGAASGAALLGVEDRAAAGLERQADELVLRRLRAAARAGPYGRVGRYSSASPVGSADSGAGSRPGSLVAATVASSVSASTSTSTSSSSSPVRAVTSSVSKSTSAWWAGRPQ